VSRFSRRPRPRHKDPLHGALYLARTGPGPDLQVVRPLLVSGVGGIALIALGEACWPGTPLGGMLTYNAAVTLYLASVGVAGGSTGMLLWPAVFLHAILTTLLTRASTTDKVPN
jgi:hypothetical protein